MTFRGLEQDTVKTADELKKEILSKGRDAWLLSSSVTLLAQGRSQYFVAKAVLKCILQYSL